MGLLSVIALGYKQAQRVVVMGTIDMGILYSRFHRLSFLASDYSDVDTIKPSASGYLRDDARLLDQHL